MNGCSDILHRGLLCVENELCSRSFPVKSSWAHSRNNKPVFEGEVEFHSNSPLSEVSWGWSCFIYGFVQCCFETVSRVAGLPWTSYVYLYPAYCSTGTEPWNKINLLGVTHLKKFNSPLPGRYQMPIVLQLFWGIHIYLSHMLGFFAWLELVLVLCML